MEPRLIKAITAIPIMLVLLALGAILIILIAIVHIITCSFVCYERNIWAHEIDLLETEERGWDGYVE